MLVILLLLFAVLAEPISNNPSITSPPRTTTPDPNCPSDVSPCSCYTFTDPRNASLKSVTIDCSGQGFTDAALTSFLTNKIPTTTPIGKFDFSWNSLTNTPDLTLYKAQSGSGTYYLNEVVLSHNPIINLAIAKLPAISSLITLRASNLSITTVDLGRINTPGPPLCRLDLSGNSLLTTVTNAGFEILECQRVTGMSAFLLLNNCAITQISMVSNEDLLVFGTTDATIDLSFNALTNIAGLKMAAIARTGTATINLSHNRITSIPLDGIRRIDGKTGVSVDFSKNNLTSLDAAVFKGNAFKRIGRQLPGVFFRPGGPAQKFSCPSCPTIVMNFSSNAITSITNGPLKLDNSGTDGSNPIVIDLSSNALTSFDGQSLSIPGSANLILDKNQISTMTNAPLAMPGTKGNAAISMQNNGIKSFDASWFSSSSSLTSALIDLSQNNIASVKTNGSSLPAWVTNNTAVDLRNNGLTQLDSAFFSPIVTERLKNGHNPATSFIRVDASKGLLIAFATVLYYVYLLNCN